MQLWYMRDVCECADSHASFPNRGWANSPYSDLHRTADWHRVADCGCMLKDVLGEWDRPQTPLGDPFCTCKGPLKVHPKRVPVLLKEVIGSFLSCGLCFVRVDRLQLCFSRGCSLASRMRLLQGFTSCTFCFASCTFLRMGRSLTSCSSLRECVLGGLFDGLAS